ncbi:Flp family type IVb pilin [Roseovarius aestuarii]|uniref:Flp/Fap pilin component n=1 Tax=Roseovarius aestuarii TaxID=475083 RepID=A0A1X7BXY7_9RHOB|nr:hypothetical protein [Roseovarius aestuarii]SMC14471.1 hypothetical protein ROA7745_04338 [Roseovarius aestuarii]
MKDFLKKPFARFGRDESGVTLVEYGIAIALAITVGTVALTGLATNISGSMGAAGAQMPQGGGGG